MKVTDKNGEKSEVKLLNKQTLDLQKGTIEFEFNEELRDYFVSESDDVIKQK